MHNLRWKRLLLMARRRTTACLARVGVADLAHSVGLHHSAVAAAASTAALAAIALLSAAVLAEVALAVAALAAAALALAALAVAVLAVVVVAYLPQRFAVSVLLLVWRQR